MKAATQGTLLSVVHPAISIHAAREGGDQLDERKRNNYAISIHAAREGGDASGRRRRRRGIFQSTPPVKAATMRTAIRKLKDGISIHAAREGGDCGNV